MFADNLFEKYDSFKEQSINHRRIKHSDILPLIRKRSGTFQIQEVGKSFEGREIFLLKAGTGKMNILLWSQMHGNESTATQALLDIFNFLEHPDEFESETKKILKQCSLYFIPMLNPDGAEQYQRRNAQEIDINRDASRLEAPESKILMGLRDDLNPDFGFNLHDQDIWYAAGNTDLPATLSFLAPTYNFDKTIDKNRENSMKLIVSMNNMLQSYIPGQTAKYNDDYMPTAFGDNIQKKGTSTILIESGGFKNDIEKQFVRKLNFVSILHAIKVIADGTYKHEDIVAYQQIEFNKKNKLFDYILRNVTIESQSGSFFADIGIRSQSLVVNDIYNVDDIGDLSQNKAYNELDLEFTKLNFVKISDRAEHLINTYF